MMEFLQAIQDSGFSTFIRESPSAYVYPSILALHAIGMAFIVGPNWAIDLRILGIAPRLPLGVLEKFFPLMWLGFWVNAVSGLALTALEPTKFFTILFFYVKLLAIACAVVNLRLLRSRVFGNPANLGTRPVSSDGKILAGTSLVFWFAAIMVGKVMEYDTYIQYESVLAVLILTGVMFVAYSLVLRPRGQEA